MQLLGLKSARLCLQGVQSLSSFLLTQIPFQAGILMRRLGSDFATGFDSTSPYRSRKYLQGYTKEAEQSVRQDGVAEKPGGALIELAEPPGIKAAERIRPDKLAQLLIDGQLEIVVAACKHQGDGFIGKPPIE